MSRFRAVGEVYQLALKVEEKLSRKSATTRGWMTGRGAKIVSAKGQSSSYRRETVEDSRHAEGTSTREKAQESRRDGHENRGRGGPSDRKGANDQP